MILSQMAVDLHMCCFHQFSGSWGPYCLDAWTGFLLNGCCRACCCRALAAIFSTNSHASVLHPNNAPENDADTIQIYIQISKFETTLNQWAKIQSGEKVQECRTVCTNLNQYTMYIVSSQIITGPYIWPMETYTLNQWLSTCCDIIWHPKSNIN